MKKLLTAGFIAAAWTVLPTAYARTLAAEVKKKGPDRPEIALTFDDGPHPVYTPILLDLLSRYNAKATFFVLGEKAELYPSLVRRMKEEGHEIGIHHYQHVSNWRLTPSALEGQLADSAAAVSAVTGQPVTYYRPPWGHFNAFTLAKAVSFQTVMWTSIPGDWKKKMTAEKLADKLRKARLNGAVITLHDSGETAGAYDRAPLAMINGLALFLADEASASFSFVTVRTLFRTA